MNRPAADEYAPYFHAYVDRVPGDDLIARLQEQGEGTRRLLAGLDEVAGMHRYAAGKWTVKRVLQHVVDGERMFTYRALCIARGEQQSLPGFDENAYAELDGSDARSLASIVAEFAAVRAASIALFSGFEDAAWRRRGVANGNPFTVRALAWVAAGHELHHRTVLRERYGVG
ncbi:MAG: DinB family protein [Planctomycetes bacterium]|nr:DinB family protein [Planctomycetota bacterium]